MTFLSGLNRYRTKVRPLGFVLKTHENYIEIFIYDSSGHCFTKLKASEVCEIHKWFPLFLMGNENDERVVELVRANGTTDSNDESILRTECPGDENFLRGILSRPRGVFVECDEVFRK